MVLKIREGRTNAAIVQPLSSHQFCLAKVAICVSFLFTVVLHSSVILHLRHFKASVCTTQLGLYQQPSKKSRGKSKYLPTQYLPIYLSVYFTEV